MKNPFKLFGSWIGIGAGLIGAYFSFAIILFLAESGKFKTIALLIPLIPTVLGFLMGWGIHALILRITRKKKLR